MFTAPPPPVADGVSDCSGLGTALLWLKGSAVSLLNLHPVGVKLLNITLLCTTVLQNSNTFCFPLKCKVKTHFDFYY